MFVAAGMISLAACSEKMSVRTDGFVSQNEIALRNVSGVTKSAVNGTAFPVGYDMLVSAYRNVDATIAPEDASANFFEGIKFAKSGDVWHAATPKYWPLTGTLDLLAVATSGLCNR